MESIYFSPFERLNKKYVKELREEAMEEGLGKGINIGFDKGDEKRAILVACWMLERNMSIDDISEATGLSMDKINSLKEKD